MDFLSPVTSRHRDYAWKVAFRLYFSCIDAHCPQWTELHWIWNATVAWLHARAPLSSFCCSTSFALNQPPPPPPPHTHPSLALVKRKRRPRRPLSPWKSSLCLGEFPSWACDLGAGTFSQGGITRAIAATFRGYLPGTVSIWVELVITEYEAAAGSRAGPPSLGVCPDLLVRRCGSASPPC